MIASAQRILDRVDFLVLQARRRDELVAEDAVLAAEESACTQSSEDVDRAARAVANLEVRLRTILKSAGIGIPEGDPTAALDAFHHGCDARRRHDAARPAASMTCSDQSTGSAVMRRCSRASRPGWPIS